MQSELEYSNKQKLFSCFPFIIVQAMKMDPLARKMNHLAQDSFRAIILMIARNQCVPSTYDQMMPSYPLSAKKNGK